jgi:hypothetical protein
LTSPEDVKGPPTAWAMTESLATVNGPIATPAGQVPGLPEGDWFVTTANIGGAAREALPAGQTTTATLSLTIAATPGTYHLAFGDGYFVDESGASVPMLTGPSFEILVQNP